jgi:CRP-like cAMP-binding protein
VFEFYDLKRFDVFRDLELSELWRLHKIIRPVHCREGGVLIKEGSLAQHLYMLQEGHLMIVFKDERAICFHEPGRVIGWSALTSDSRYTATVVCLTDCTLLTFAASDLLSLLGSNATLGTRIMNKIARVRKNRLPFIPENGRLNIIKKS